LQFGAVPLVAGVGTGDTIGSAMAERRLPSELECFTLGLIWQAGPCTPYQVRKQMLDSPSTQWSGSAGSIYPLMRRLKSRGWLRVKQEATGRRKHETYSITAAGVKALKQWVGPPMADEAVTVAYDPLRSRARFLGVLTRRQQLAWLEAALEVLDTVAARVKEWETLYAEDDEFLRVVSRSGDLDVQSRRKWLQSAKARLAGSTDS
jgi:DNA-binding PadR family transcriptional regulator